MIELKAFKAIRPNEKLAKKVASLPYDVIESTEAKAMIKDNPYSFLRINKAEIDFDAKVNQYDISVYKRAKENLEDMLRNNILIKDDEESLYIYKQIMDKREQIGLVGTFAIDDYINNKIKKHEKTLLEKVKDRTNHIDYCNANTGPIFLTYRDKENVNKILENWIRNNKALYDFVSDDDISHQVWQINDKETIEKIIGQIKKIDNLYIADGHHRIASASEVAKIRRKNKPNYTGKEKFNYFLGVLFPFDQLYVMDYNRVIKDLNGYCHQDFINKVKEKFLVEEYLEAGPYKPNKKHNFGMHLNNKWYSLCAKSGSFDYNDTVKSLDASILQDNLLEPLLAIDNPRVNKRIDFVGGIRGLNELEKRVENGMAIAFSMYPTDIKDLIEVADEGRTMPPKSTWFEPKLRSGLFVFDLE